LGFPPIKWQLVGAYCVNMATSNLFILMMWWSLGVKSYWTFWIFLFLSHFVRCLQLHIFAILSIFRIFLHHFSSLPDLVSQYVISIGIFFQSFFHFLISFQLFPHFFSHLLSSFSIFPTGPCHKRFCLWKNQKIN